MATDEEIASVVYYYILCSEEESKNRKCWVYPINEKRNIKHFVKELRADEQKFKNFTRIELKSFDYLLEILSDKITKQNTNFRTSISAEERLLITLRFLATRVGATTIGIIVMDVCQTICDILTSLYMPRPTEEKWKQIANRFDDLWNFPNSCGAIDGKHIRLERPHNVGSVYYNYKKYHSFILQAVVDADAKFVSVDIGDYGKNKDSGVFNHSVFGKHFYEKKLEIPRAQKISPRGKPLPFVFVADEAYPLLTNIMRPFTRKSLTRERRIYNYRHSRARRIVECAFGMLAKKFRTFESAMLLEADKATVVTNACCLLYNMIREREGTVDDIHQQLLTQEVQIENDITDEHNQARGSNVGYKVRNDLLSFFNSPAGSVYWQDKHALIE